MNAGIKRCAHAVTLLVMLMALGACSTMGSKMRSPTLSIVSIALVSADIFSQQFRVRLRLENPNDRDLPVKSIEYELALQGDAFSEGTSVTPVNIPAHGDTEFDLTLHTKYIASIGRLMSRLEGSNDKKVEYNMVGTLHLASGFGSKIPFAQTGIVDLKTVR